MILPFFLCTVKLQYVVLKSQSCLRQHMFVRLVVALHCRRRWIKCCSVHIGMMKPKCGC
jgi:hypothetical protein